MNHIIARLYLKKARSLRQPESKQVPFIAPLFEIRLKIGKLTKEEISDEKRERREICKKRVDNEKGTKINPILLSTIFVSGQNDQILTQEIRHLNGNFDQSHSCQV